MLRCHLKKHFYSVIYTFFYLIVFILFILSSCPESVTLLAFLFMQEYREKKMDKKKANKPIYQNYFHGTNKYTNGVFFVFVLFSAEMWPKHIRRRLKVNQKTGHKVCSTQ